jgi:hypothetical protein
VGPNAASSNTSGSAPSLPWFSTNGQKADLALKFLLAALAGANGWSQMKQNEFLSAGFRTKPSTQH